MREWSTCPVCSGSASETFVEFEELAFARCVGCGTVYKRFEKNEPDGEFYEQGYFHGRKSGRDKRFEHRVRKAMDWLRSALEHRTPSARALLDVGCSFGYVLEAGQRLGLTAAGADISTYAVEVCGKRGYRAAVGSLEKLPYGDGEFDVVMMKHVLEHTPQPRAALAEVRRVTAAGAVALIAVPDLRYWKGMKRRRTYRYFRPDDLGQQHYVYYTVESLSALLEACGFEVVERSKAFFRARLARASVWRRLYEPLRYTFMTAVMALGEGLSLRRELFVIARKRP